MSERDDVAVVKKGVKTPPIVARATAGTGGTSAAPRRPGRSYRPAPYPYEIRRRAVRLYLEEGINAHLVQLTAFLDT